MISFGLMIQQFSANQCAWSCNLGKNIARQSVLSETAFFSLSNDCSKYNEDLVFNRKLNELRSARFKQWVTYACRWVFNTICFLWLSIVLWKSSIMYKCFSQVVRGFCGIDRMFFSKLQCLSTQRTFENYLPVLLEKSMGYLFVEKVCGRFSLPGFLRRGKVIILTFVY